MQDDRMILLAIRLAIAAHGCRSAAAKDPQRLAPLKACAGRYSRQSAALLADVCRRD